VTGAAGRLVTGAAGRLMTGAAGRLMTGAAGRSPAAENAFISFPVRAPLHRVLDRLPHPRRRSRSTVVQETR
jgi:hypothetical protein